MSASLHSTVPARPVRTAANVLVGVLVTPDAPAIAMPSTFARWRALTPLATWLPIALGEPGYADILSGVAAALERAGMTPRQLILLGEGPVARSMLELALRGELPCGGIVAIDVPCGALPFPIVPTVTAMRLVIRRDGDEALRGDLIGALRSADLDARIITLDLTAGRAAGAAASVTETFVLELVATIGRRTIDGVGDP
ncbi:hypothetical protein [Bradyrhizobium sp. 2S1]|uniref:hypothetical protein n=1 Tax=Bradyrhizobium sp. 2S1 TaxID=1404429 RepID=UPI001CD0D37B|nr:hypothetical protein [Bradyrhizobium sp. 2S1]MCK7673662.1 hypothetical protein [Bradyrhizobium sp. 2S1]